MPYTKTFSVKGLLLHPHRVSLQQRTTADMMCADYGNDTHLRKQRLRYYYDRERQKHTYKYEIENYSNAYFRASVVKVKSQPSVIQVTNSYFVLFGHSPWRGGPTILSLLQCRQSYYRNRTTSNHPRHV